ncbi:MAG: hypothetical protein HYV26_10440 [Candidatus Hydrogenedentes bacterium]|nr:hypothetical protein [Candidatus Hydrogenedentota bacterium]
MRSVLYVVAAVLTWTGIAAGETWEAEVFPAEREISGDAESGARLIFVTSNTAEDSNLYFHQHSWLADSSLLVFRTVRSGKMELFGYIEATGELCRLQQPGHVLQGDTTASAFGNRMYVVRDGQVCEWTIEVASATPGTATQVSVTERIIGPLPELPGSVTGLNENSDGTLLILGFTAVPPAASHIVWMEPATGAVRQKAAIGAAISHTQASATQPGLVMFTRDSTDRAATLQTGSLSQRMWLVSIDKPEPWKLYRQLEGELVTHEHFWTEDRVVFCTGIPRAGYAEESHVKVIDINTGIARIICPGSWWPGGSPEEVAKLNWWHCAGAPNGRFVAADNWHGVIAITSGLSARYRVLTSGHRTYGSGPHPHVGWDPTGYRVVFASNQRGNSDVVIAELPESWKGDW